MTIKRQNKTHRTKQNELNFRYISDREASFRKAWFPENASCSAPKMAKAGFYFTNGDRSSLFAKCFYCSKELEWEIHDDPWEEHLRHSPNCPYVKMFDQAPESITFRQLLMLENERVQFFTKMFKQQFSFD